MKDKPPATNSLIRHGSLLSLLTLISRVLGLVREMVKAALLGTSPLSDAFTIALMIPNLLRRLFAEGSIAAAFIPTFKGCLRRNNQAETKDFLSAIFSLLSCLVSLTVAIGILAAPWLVRLFGLSEYKETVYLTRLMFPYLAFVSIAAFLQGILNSVHVFAPTGFAPILLNLAVISSALLLSPWTANPARAMAGGVVIGGILEAAIQLPFVLKQGFRFGCQSVRKAFRNPGTKTVLRLIGPTIIGMAAYQLNDLVSTALAGNAGPGIVSSLQYSLRLQELILGVFAVSLGTVLLPDLAGHAKNGRWQAYNDQLISAMDLIALITIPISVFAFIRAETMIRLLFQTRSFDDQSVALTRLAFSFHIPGLFFIALNRILAPAFYAMSDSKSPTIAGILSFLCNMVLAALLVGPMKGGGVALALSLAGLINTVGLFAFMSRNPKVAARRALQSLLLYAGKILGFSVVAGLVCWLFDSPINRLFASQSRLVSQGGPLLVSALLFAILGISLLVLTGDKQLKALAGWLKRKPST